MPQYNNLQEEELKLKRRDLLVPQDIRERKGSFFTPKIWVDLSQKYLADVLGENWQDEYYVWDCAAGTGNLLNGLTNKYHIWASTLDQQDVDVMKDRIKNGANLLDSHVFQFDFLNDEFTKLPQPLQDIINDLEKRQKLVIYINPPYAEAGNARMRSGEQNKNDVSNTTQIWERYKSLLGLGIRELFTQFIIRIHEELKPCKLAVFSTPKYIAGTAFRSFRQHFPMRFVAGFVVPANTFDNVKGDFPISFIIWESEHNTPIHSVKLDVYNTAGECAAHQKTFAARDTTKRISEWMQLGTNEELEIGYTGNFGPDFQHNQDLCILNARKTNSNNANSNATKYRITASTLLQTAIYFAVRLSIAHSWLNNRDQFLYPLEGWQDDTEFQNNCLVFMLFHGKNRIVASAGSNHWIPFTEEEVEAKETFESHFMTDFISGRCASGANTKYEVLGTTQSEEKKAKRRTGTLRDLAQELSFVPTEPLLFSPEATAVFDAGRELWRYYHAQPNANPNASYYDIREYFQGRKSVLGQDENATSAPNSRKRRMNSKSEDAEYMRLLTNLKEAMEALRLQIVPKVYEYNFLIE